MRAAFGIVARGTVKLLAEKLPRSVSMHKTIERWSKTMGPQANDCKRHEDRRINEARAAHVFQVADILR
jgi:hypothetical protein